MIGMMMTITTTTMRGGFKKMTDHNGAFSFEVPVLEEVVDCFLKSCQHTGMDEVSSSR
jgi:hypothetical protein